MNRCFKYIFLVGLLVAVLCSVTTLVILWVGFSDNIHQSDVAVILGNQVNRHGLPTPRLAARLNKGIELYQQGCFKHIIVSGGTEKNGFNEADVMKNYLLAHHIPASVIIKDRYAKNTWQTAVNTKHIMAQQSYKNIIVISQYFHIARTELAFTRCGISPIYHAHANIFESRYLYSIPREVVGIYYYFLFHVDHEELK